MQAYNLSIFARSLFVLCHLRKKFEGAEPLVLFLTPMRGKPPLPKSCCYLVGPFKKRAP